MTESYKKLKSVSMPSRADDSFLLPLAFVGGKNVIVSMPSRADDSFLHAVPVAFQRAVLKVSMPSRADDSFLPGIKIEMSVKAEK